MLNRMVAINKKGAVKSGLLLTAPILVKLKFYSGI